MDFSLSSWFYYLVFRVTHAAGSTAASGRRSPGIREWLSASAAGVQVTPQRSVRQGPKKLQHEESMEMAGLVLAVQLVQLALRYQVSIPSCSEF